MSLFFFVVAFLFVPPVSWVSRNFLLSSPGVQSVFFCALLGAATFRRGQSKIFFCSGPGERQGKERPVGRRHGARAFNASRRGGVCFFCCGPARTGVVGFFCCGPARTLTHSLWAGGISARPGWCPGCFFLLWPRAGAAFRRGRSKKTPWVGRGAQRGATKKTLCTPGDDSKKHSRNQ